MKRAALLLILTICFALPATATFQQAVQQKQDRFRTNPIEPDGFLGIRLGNTFRYAEDIFGEPDVVRNGSLEWHFRDADYDPYEALTILGDKKKIVGFVAHMRPNRIQFKDMNLEPKTNQFGTYSATRKYVSGDFAVSILVVGDDANYVRRVIIQAKDQK